MDESIKITRDQLRELSAEVAESVERMSATTNPVQEPFPAFEDEEGNIKVLEGKTLSKNNGWWAGILLVDTYGKLQVKIYLWQQRQEKNKPGVSVWKKKQSLTVNPFNWPDTKKIVDEFLEKKKSIKPSTAAFQRRNP